jgi:hypothetical protein
LTNHKIKIVVFVWIRLQPEGENTYAAVHNYCDDNSDDEEKRKTLMAVLGPVAVLTEEETIMVREQIKTEAARWTQATLETRSDKKTASRALEQQKRTLGSKKRRGKTVILSQRRLEVEQNERSRPVTTGEGMDTDMDWEADALNDQEKEEEVDPSISTTIAKARSRPPRPTSVSSVHSAPEGDDISRSPRSAHLSAPSSRSRSRSTSPERTSLGRQPGEGPSPAKKARRTPSPVGSIPKIQIEPASDVREGLEAGVRDMRISPQKLNVQTRSKSVPTRESQAVGTRRSISANRVSADTGKTKGDSVQSSKKDDNTHEKESGRAVGRTSKSATGSEAQGERATDTKGGTGVETRGRRR